MEREDQIQRIAYQLWEEEGCPQGRSLEHYFKAEAIVLFQQKQGVVAPSSSGLRSQTRPRVTSPQG
jgi:hypothetical protein